MRFFFAFLMVLLLFFSCSDKNENKVDVSMINVDFSVKRYDVDFYNATKETLPKVKEKYPYLFPEVFLIVCLSLKLMINKNKNYLLKLRKFIMIFHRRKSIDITF